MRDARTVCGLRTLLDIVAAVQVKSPRSADERGITATAPAEVLKTLLVLFATSELEPQRSTHGIPTAK
jgi:hypothetical protein